MIIARHETITLPNNEDGQFMAPYYMDDMTDSGLTTYSTATTSCIVIHGSYVGDCPEEFIDKLRQKIKDQMKNGVKCSNDEIQHVGYDEEQCGRTK